MSNSRGHGISLHAGRARVADQFALNDFGAASTDHVVFVLTPEFDQHDRQDVAQDRRRRFGVGRHNDDVIGQPLEYGGTPAHAAYKQAERTALIMAGLHVEDAEGVPRGVFDLSPLRVFKHKWCINFAFAHTLPFSVVNAGREFGSDERRAVAQDDNGVQQPLTVDRMPAPGEQQQIGGFNSDGHVTAPSRVRAEA